MTDGLGQHKSWDDFWHQWYPKIYGYSRSFSPGKQHHRDDLVQGAMERIWVKRDKYSKSWALSTWVYRVARNHFIDQIRKSSSHGADTSNGSDAFALESYPCRDRGPAQQLHRKETQSAVEAALLTLKNEDRELLELRFGAELPYEEISQITNRPVGSLKSQVHRAKEKLRPLLADWKEEVV